MPHKLQLMLPVSPNLIENTRDLLYSEEHILGVVIFQNSFAVYNIMSTVALVQTNHSLENRIYNLKILSREA